MQWFFLSALLTHSIFGFAQNNAVSNSLCHPSIDPQMPQYIIGYGSLIQNQSRKDTYQYAENALPVMVYGYQRGWFVQGTRNTFKTTFLSVVRNEKSQFNGVIFKVNREGMTRYDAREKYYCRETVSPSHIQMLNHQSVPHGQFWVYITPTDKITAPSKNYPILQSYVNIFLSGCLAVQKQYGLKNFLNDCVDTTHNWSSHWINERIDPIATVVA